MFQVQIWSAPGPAYFMYSMRSPKLIIVSIWITIWLPSSPDNTVFPPLCCGVLFFTNQVTSKGEGSSWISNSISLAKFSIPASISHFLNCYRLLVLRAGKLGPASLLFLFKITFVSADILKLDFLFKIVFSFSGFIGTLPYGFPKNNTWQPSNKLNYVLK